MTNTLVIARRKGSKVRMFNTRTAKMGPWVAVPYSRTVRIVGRRAGKVAAQQAEMRAYWRVPENARRIDRLTVRELQSGCRVAGVAYTTRMRKAELIALLTGADS